MQAASTVAADSRQPTQDAFNAGYTAGASDAFGNFDGGWEVAAPVPADRRPRGRGHYLLDHDSHCCCPTSTITYARTAHAPIVHDGASN